jgi:quinohemoprotein ethanol dehydrogenase
MTSFLYGYDSSWKFNQVKEFGSGTGWNTGSDINFAHPNKGDPNAPKGGAQGFLLAWDPVKQQEVWRVKQEAHWNGGVVITAAGLVFQGTADGNLTALDGDNGKLLWKVNAGTGVTVPPYYLQCGWYSVHKFPGGLGWIWRSNERKSHSGYFSGTYLYFPS